MQAIRATLLLCLLIIASVADGYNTWIHPRSLCILGLQQRWPCCREHGSTEAAIPAKARSHSFLKHNTVATVRD